jgi:hypothetical protein
MLRRWKYLLTLCGAGLLAAASGCQTWVPQSGQTLPSGYYLDHPPQFIPDSPPFPLPKELSSLEQATRAYSAAQGLQPQ